MGFLNIFKTRIKDDIDIKRNKKVKLGLALGGGATRGYGHIGALKAFAEYGIEFDYVAGTSVGSLIGSLYCVFIILTFPRLSSYAQLNNK